MKFLWLYFSNTSCILILSLLSIAVLLLRFKEQTNIDAQNTHNFIRGNINNIPIVVIINLIVLMYIFYVMIKNKFLDW